MKDSIFQTSRYNVYKAEWEVVSEMAKSTLFMIHTSCF